MNKLKLLIVDDEANMRHMLKALVERHGYDIATAEHGEAALELVTDNQFDFILCDVKMPVMDGLTFLHEAKGFLAETSVIMMSAFGTVDLALEAMKAGAYDFISKPFKADEVLMSLKKAEEREQLRRENLRLKEEIAKIQGNSFGRMIAISSGMKEVFHLAKKVAVYDTTVLITGESGTGKELIAKGIHENSGRKDMPFVAINCGSIPENLLESELFGHVKGAFTGADRSSKGLFEEADGSTIFLDEIGELPLALQVKLLRVLQEREIRPVGSQTSKDVDIRVLAATASDLFKRVSEGTFREDLYYRLNVVPVWIPPLRKRPEDVTGLVNLFINRFNKVLGTSVTGASPDAMGLMLSYRWPGNVRELENTIQRAMVVSGSNTIGTAHLPKKIQDQTKQGRPDHNLQIDGLSIKKAQKQLESDLIKKALDTCGGNKSRASELLEISYPSLLQKIKNYKI